MKLTQIMGTCSCGERNEEAPEHDGTQTYRKAATSRAARPLPPRTPAKERSNPTPNPTPAKAATQHDGGAAGGASPSPSASPVNPDQSHSDQQDDVTESTAPEQSGVAGVTGPVVTDNATGDSWRTVPNTDF